MRFRSLTHGMLACLAVMATGAAARGDTISLPSPLQVRAAVLDDHVAQLTFDPAVYAQLRGVDRVTLTGFPLGPTEVVDLDLRRRDILAPNAQIIRVTAAGEEPGPMPDVVLLGGHIVGEPDSTVFLGLSPAGGNGLVQRDGAAYVLSSGPAAGSDVVYDLTALPEGTIQWRDFECFVDALDFDVPPGGGVGGGPVIGGADCRLAKIALETDYEFTADLFGGDDTTSTAYALTLLGAVSEIYERDVKTRLGVTYIRTWLTSSDPWGQTSTTNQLLEFRDYWEANMPIIDRNVAHFLSGRGLGGGVAWLPGLCQPALAYGLSANINGFFPYPLEDNNGQNWDVVVVAHELGHNFGAPHTHDHVPQIDNCAGGDCADAANGTLMSYCHLCPGGIANFNLFFHPMIEDNIFAYLNNGAPCDLVSGGETDISGDGSVNTVDLLVLLGAWGPCPAAPCAADVSCDGTVDTSDLLDLLADWG